MKKFLKLYIYLSIAVLTGGCTKNFDEINTNPKGLTAKSLDASSYGYEVIGAFYQTCYLKNHSLFQLGQSLFSDIYANYFALTNPSFVSDRYVLNDAWLKASFGQFYYLVAPQIHYSVDFARTNGYVKEEAMMKIWKIYAYSMITELYGPIPYTHACNQQTSIPYDDEKTIYTTFFAQLDSAITVLKDNAGTTSTLLSNYDPIYSGNIDKWAKFGSSLRLRLALHVKYVTPDVAKTQAEKAVEDGVITDNADNALVKTTAVWFNPYIGLTTKWKSEFRMSTDMESILKGYLDPRVQNFFQKSAIPDKTDDPIGVVFDWEGMRNGQTIISLTANDFKNKASDIGIAWATTGSSGPSWPIIRAFETDLLRAEGALEGWNMGGTAADLYKAGIEASLKENGYSDLKNLEGAEYSTSALVPASVGFDLSDPTTTLAPVSTVPVAFMTAGTKEQQLEQIITQKWIGLYPDSPEAYTERRRTKYPTLYQRLGSDNPDVPASSFPTRMAYVSSEYTYNAQEVANAVVLLGGTDNGATKLWWDKK